MDDFTPLTLIYVPEQRAIVHFPQGLQGKACFEKDSEIIENAMRYAGINIPVMFKERYPELKEAHSSIIYLDDGSFGRAFYEVYYPEGFNPEKFIWKPYVKGQE